jgi:hypothetical protein
MHFGNPQDLYSVLPDFDPRELTEYYFDLVQTTAAEDADLTRQSRNSLDTLNL